MSAVEIVWGSEVVELADPGAHRAVLESHPDVGGVAVGDVHPERGFGAGASHDGRRQRLRPSGRGRGATSAAARSSAVAAGTPSAPSTATSVLLGYVDPVPGPVVVIGGHAERCGRARSARRPGQSWPAILLGSRALRRARADRPRCRGVPPGVPGPRRRTPPGSAGRRCTGWTSCSSRRPVTGTASRSPTAGSRSGTPSIS